MNLSLTRSGSERPRGRTLVAAFSALVLGAALSAAAVVPAQADESAQVTASPASIAAGQTSTITATGLGGLQEATFGLDSTPGGSFTENGATSYQASVSGGKATATFTASKAGTFTIAVGTGESALGTVTVTVTAPDPAPAPQPPAAPATISAQPAQVDAGESTTLTAMGLGGMQSVTFGTDATSGATFLPGNQTTQQSTVKDGTATAEFVAEEPGTYTVVVTTGETVLATTTVTVSAAPEPEPEPTVTHAAAPHEDAGIPVVTWVVIGVVALLIAAGIVTWVIVARRKRQAAAESEV